MSLHRRPAWWARLQMIKLSTAVTAALLISAAIVTYTMVAQKHQKGELVGQVNMLADPILAACAGSRGPDFAHQLADAGYCSQAASAKSLPVVADPDALVNPQVRGPKGDPGEPGPSGRDGKNGIDGPPGKDGSPATSMTLNGSGVVYTCRRSGGANTSPVYNCPGLGGVQPALGGLPPGVGPAMFPPPSRYFPRPPGHGPRRDPPVQPDSPVPPDAGAPTP